MDSTASRKRKDVSHENNESASALPDDSVDEAIRQELCDHHAEKRAKLLAEHARQLEAFDASCRAERSAEGFRTCLFFLEAKARRAKEALVGYCSVCKEALTVEGKAVDEEDRDGMTSKDFDGEMCHCCKEHMCETDTGSMKCSKCVWPLCCSSKKGKKHRFCSSCVEIVKTDPDSFDLPRRFDPGDDGEYLERDFLHPFELCDCGICAWCGEDDEECCRDHRNQLCSCYP